MTTTTTTPTLVVLGRTIWIDRSGGHGHAWRTATADECPADTQEAIAAEMIDGARPICDDYVAPNGLHYRW